MGAKVGGSGLVLGLLTELVVVGSGSDKCLGPFDLRGWYLAWMPKTRDLAIVRKTSRPANMSQVGSQALNTFKRFHKSASKRAAVFEWPERSGLRQVGRLRSLTYVVPNTIRSPEKNGTRWIHAFGDHGESGHGEFTGTKMYPTRLMPMLSEGSDGSLHILRQPGNKYNVTEWIYW
jgi:hypothetical protein